MNNARLIIGIIVVVLVIGGFFIFKPIKSTDDYMAPNKEDIGNLDDSIQNSLGEWRNYELKDIKSGESFKISDFSDKPVLLESFAVWCPSCTSQQFKIKELHEELGDSVISISLNTDAGEDEAKVLEHIESNGFDWYYAISSNDFTKSLVDEFGTSILSAPSVPIILICPDGSAEKLKSGSKSVEFLKEKINSC